MPSDLAPKYVVPVNKSEQDTLALCQLSYVPKMGNAWTRTKNLSLIR